MVAYKQPVSRGPGLGDPRRQRRRRDAHAASPAAWSRRPAHDARDRRATSTAPRATSWSGSASPRSTSCPSSRRSCPTWPTSRTSTPDGAADRTEPPTADEPSRHEPSTTDDDGPGPAAEAARPVRGGQPPQVRGADARRRWSRSTARWSPGSAPRSTRRTAVIRVDGQAAAAGQPARLPGAEQAARRRLDDVGPARAAARSPTSSPTGPSGSSTSAGSTPTPRG